MTSGQDGVAIETVRIVPPDESPHETVLGAFRTRDEARDYAEEPPSLSHPPLLLASPTTHLAASSTPGQVPAVRVVRAAWMAVDEQQPPVGDESDDRDVRGPRGVVIRGLNQPTRTPLWRRPR